MLRFPEWLQCLGRSPYPVAEYSLAYPLQPDAFKLLYLAVERQMKTVFVVYSRCERKYKSYKRLEIYQLDYLQDKAT